MQSDRQSNLPPIYLILTDCNLAALLISMMAAVTLGTWGQKELCTYYGGYFDPVRALHQLELKGKYLI